jgi:hypothetical protein
MSKMAHMTHFTFATQVMTKKKLGIKLTIWLVVGNQLDLGASKWSAIHRWKAFDESYKFSLDFVLIGGLNKEL